MCGEVTQFNQAMLAATPQPDPEDYGYGQRADGSYKGPGFMGPLKRPDGNVSTELSIGVNLDGKEREVPLLVPTLSKQEVDHLLADGAPTDAMVNKAVEHARQRLREGKSPFFGRGDESIANRLYRNPALPGVNGAPRDTGYKASTPAPITGKRG